MSRYFLFTTIFLSTTALRCALALFRSFRSFKNPKWRKSIKLVHVFVSSNSFI